MDNSTDGVKLYAVFINDILGLYEEKHTEYSELFDLVKDLDLSEPFAWVPMHYYNDICAWLEKNLGKFNLIRGGRAIGETVYTALQANKMLPEKPTPLSVLEALKVAADTMIDDPLKRGWVVKEDGPKRILMTRTQTFNSPLQLGLLDGLVRKTGVPGVRIDYVEEVANGAEYDVYSVSWL